MVTVPCQLPTGVRQSVNFSPSRIPQAEVSLWLPVLFNFVWGASSVLCAADDSQHTPEPPSRLPLPEAATTQHFLEQHCLRCHGEESESQLDMRTLLDRPIADHFEAWHQIYEQVQRQEMPPPEESKPSPAQSRRFLSTLKSGIYRALLPGVAETSYLAHPRYGNYVDHADLFTATPSVVRPGPPRIWRLRSGAYQQRYLTTAETAVSKIHAAGNRNDTATADYSQLQSLDEPTTEQLFKNAEQIAKSRFSAVTQRIAECTPDDTRKKHDCLRDLITQLFYRQPNDAELTRYHNLHQQLLTLAPSKIAAERLVMAVLMQPEAIFREELGEDEPDEFGRVRLAPRELAISISLSLGDTVDPQLILAAKEGRLGNNTFLRLYLEKRLNQPISMGRNPRLLQFFREFFGYPNATTVFKIPPLHGTHDAEALIQDLDLLIAHILDKDTLVLRELLTTDRAFVSCRRDQITGQIISNPRVAETAKASLSGQNPEPGSVYGLPRDWIWTADQPVRLPAGMRAGILTHPAWLVAWSGNFDNHPVQRGLWIRTHLLGGVVPEIPIEVDATLGDADGRQLRSRLLTATADTYCQRCHRKMDQLGLPFEQYDHYGRYRVHESKQPVNTSGSIGFTEDRDLHSTVADPLELMHHLADSTFVEQVFVRHAFRYLLGRNETVGDAATLQQAWQAYHENSGSFRALVQTILLSDSFLLRQAADRHEQ